MVFEAFFQNRRFCLLKCGGKCDTIDMISALGGNRFFGGFFAVKNKLFGFVYAMNYIAQAAWSFVFPAGLIVGLGYFLVRRFSLGKGVLVAAIVLGVLSGVYSMFRYIIRMADYATGDFNKDEKGRK